VLVTTTEGAAALRRWSEVDKAQSEAAQTGPLAQAEAQRAVIAAQAELAQHPAELRQWKTRCPRPEHGRGQRAASGAVADYR
jgi:flotillin